MRAFPRPASHRELIHLAMVLKESGIVTGVEHVSKTKVRGVLAILKQGQLVTKVGTMGDAVQLFLREDIDTFGRLRDRHDHFLLSYMMENLLNIPEDLMGEIVWRVDGGRKQQRVELLESMIGQLMPIALAEVSRMGDQYSGGREGDGDMFEREGGRGWEGNDAAGGYGMSEYSKTFSYDNHNFYSNQSETTPDSKYYSTAQLSPTLSNNTFASSSAMASITQPSNLSSTPSTTLISSQPLSTLFPPSTSATNASLIDIDRIITEDPFPTSTQFEEDVTHHHITAINQSINW